MRIRVAGVKFLAILALMSFAALRGAAAGWVAIGPHGGDARALASDPKDPNRMYAGTRTGQVYLTKIGRAHV